MENAWIVSFDKLFHVGTLNIADKASVFKESLEGSGLSVSEFPEAWSQIAKLGGSPIWELRKEANQFLDYYALGSFELANIEEWGLTNEWVELITVWVFEYEDCEDGRKRYIEFETEAAALQEADSGVDGIISEKDALRALPRLIAHAGYTPTPMLVPDLLAIAFAEFELKVDGVFWGEAYEPEAYSAPRAVIVSSKVDEWQKIKI